MSAAIAFAIPYAGGPQPFLLAAIESVRAQTIPDWQLVVVDDASHETGVRALVEGLGDARITYARNDGPHGIAAGWNACLDTAAAEFLTILHADDELEPRYAAEMLELARRIPDAALYYCDATIVDGRGAAVFSLADRFKALIAPRSDPARLSGERGIAALCVGNFIICPTVLYRLPALRGRRFSVRWRFTLDLAFYVDTLLDGASIAGTQRRLFRYRRHAVQQTKILDRDTARVDEERAFYDELATRVRGGPFASVAPLARLRLSTRLNALVSLSGDVRAGRFALARKKAASALRR